MTIIFDLRKAIKNLSDKEKAIMSDLKEIVKKLKCEECEQALKRTDYHVTANTENVTEEHKKAQFQKEIDYFSKDLQLYRYCYGEGWDIKSAEEALKKTIAWRLRDRPASITLESCKMAGVSEFIFTHGVDTEGQPLMFLLMEPFSKALSEAHEKNTWPQLKESMFRLLMYTIENLQQRMIHSSEDEPHSLPSHVHRITWVIDMQNTALSLSQARALKDIFFAVGEYYPERMARCVIINASFWLNMIFSFAKSFMSATTRQKLIFLKGSNSTIKSKISKVIHPDEIPQFLGFGNSTFTYSFQQSVETEQEHSTKAVNKRVQSVHAQQTC